MPDFSEADGHSSARAHPRASSSALRASSTASGGEPRLRCSPGRGAAPLGFRIAARFDMDTERDAFVSSLAKFTYLTTIKAGKS